MKTLVLGLGNPVLTDDAVGPRTSARLREQLNGQCGDDLEVDEHFRGGLQLMERLVGYERAIIIDATRTGAEPGEVQVFTIEGVPTQNTASAHDATLPTALELGRRCGAKLPAIGDIVVVGIEADDVLNFGEQCTPPVEAAIPRAVEVVLGILEQWSGKP